MIDKIEFLSQRMKAKKLLQDWKSKIKNKQQKGSTVDTTLNKSIYFSSSWTGTKEQFEDYINNKYIERNEEE